MSSIPELRGRLDAHVEPCLVEGLCSERRRIPLSHSSHVRGWHPVRKGHPPVQFESRLECRVITALARFPQLQNLKTQPVTVVYRCADRIHRYTPDLLVTLSNVPEALRLLGFGQRTYIEVKPQRRAIQAEHILRRQFSVVRQATDLPVVLITDWDLPSTAMEERHVA